MSQDNMSTQNIACVSMKMRLKLETNVVYYTIKMKFEGRI